ncbi:hypothetical protein FACS1894113_3120 [Alphaproteobacteria bacterium]|nr:hypothetical protein FACS1894113_3120 [Alphaproteobacteria bacterium]
MEIGFCEKVVADCGLGWYNDTEGIISIIKIMNRKILKKNIIRASLSAIVSCCGLLNGVNVTNATEKKRAMTYALFS